MSLIASAIDGPVRRMLSMVRGKKKASEPDGRGAQFHREAGGETFRRIVETYLNWYEFWAKVSPAGERSFTFRGNKFDVDTGY